jgi:hypothetical protein
MGRVDLDVLREKNKELMTRVQELDLQLFQTLIQPLQKKLATHSSRRVLVPRVKEGGNKRPDTDDEFLFEDAREDGSQMTTDSEDKQSHHTDPEIELEASFSREDFSSRSPSKASDEERTTKLISLYEQQFEKMKV